jgi:serine/threonine-protein kinase RsbW
MRLAVTEACTNVVRHAYTGDEADDQSALRVELRPQPRGMLVVVEDRGRGVAPSPDGGGPGLGLPLIAALTRTSRSPTAPVRGAVASRCPSPR